MRNMDEMLEEVRSKANAITKEEVKEQREAQGHYGDARNLRDQALQYRRSQSYLEEDGMSSNMVQAYKKLAEALEECAEQHTYRADHLCQRLAQRNKTVTISTEE